MKRSTKRALHRGIHWLAALGLALSIWGGGQPAQAQAPQGLSWQLEMQVRVPQADETAQEAVRQALAERLEGSAAAVTGVGTADAQSEWVQVSAQGEAPEGTALAEVLFADLAGGFDFLGGPAEVELSGWAEQGQRLSLTLEARPAAGYQWTLAGLEESGLRLTAEPYQTSRGSYPGAPAQVHFDLEAAISGEARLRLVYQRPFEVSQAPLARLNVQMGQWMEAVDLSSPLEALPTPEVGENVPPPESVLGSLQATQLPASYSLLALGKTTPVRDQGSCGSCWAFGTVGVMESALMVQKGAAATDLSEQFLISCNQDGYGCGGGYWFAHDYHTDELGRQQSSVGAVLEANMPYSASNGSCKVVDAHPYRQSAWFFVGGNWTVTPSQQQIKEAIYRYGPVGASVCVGPAFQNYRGGVFAKNEASSCGGNSWSTNHAVVIVGWNDADNTWLIRNSWGSWWGEQGYMRIQRGISNLGSAANFVVFDPTPVTDTCYAVNVQSSAGGSVQVNPGPNCPSGSGYRQGTVVQMTAAPEYGYEFTGWSGAVTSTDGMTTLVVKANSSVTANFRLIEPPVNDDRAQAIVWAGQSGVQSFHDTRNTLNASTAPDDPRLPRKSAPQGYRSVWYRFTPLGPGTLRLSTLGSEYDTIAAVWAEAAGGGLEPKVVKWNDNAGKKRHSSLSASLKGGQTYWIEVVSKTTTAGVLVVDGQFTPRKASNDTRGSALRITDALAGETHYHASLDVWNATTAASDPLFDGSPLHRSVWFRYKPRQNGTLTVDLAGSDFAGRVGVYTSSPSGLRTAAQAGTRLEDTPLVGGLTYYIEVVSQDPNAPSWLELDLRYVPGAPLSAGEYDLPADGLVTLGGWQPAGREGALNGSLLTSQELYAASGLTFTGSRAEVVYSRLTQGGVVQILVDGRVTALRGQKSSTETDQVVWRTPKLKPGVHTITFVHRSGAMVNVDAVRVLP